MVTRSRLRKAGSGVKKPTRLKRQSQALIKEIKERGFIRENEVNLLRRRLNDKKITQEDVELLMDIKITPEQTKKGLDWLMNKWKTPRGVERKNNPFGYREQRALETFEEFRLNSFFNNVNIYQAEAGINNYIAVWDVIGKDANFQYYMEAGMPKIIG